jgi:hypothetical protein
MGRDCLADGQSKSQSHGGTWAYTLPGWLGLAVGLCRFPYLSLVNSTTSQAAEEVLTLVPGGRSPADAWLQAARPVAGARSLRA